MISGIVNSNIEAVISLTASGPTTVEQVFDAVVDTGFSGDVTMPFDLIRVLGLKWQGIGVGELADGREEVFDVYDGLVMWDGKSRRVEIEAAETQPLIGMNLLCGSALRIDVIPGGAVQINPLRTTTDSGN
ncbi:MAG: clan AA aspartic protease [Planctomycetaceae bacterium]